MLACPFYRLILLKTTAEVKALGKLEVLGRATHTEEYVQVDWFLAKISKMVHWQDPSVYETIPPIVGARPFIQIFL